MFCQNRATMGFITQSVVSHLGVFPIASLSAWIPWTHHDLPAWQYLLIFSKTSATASLVHHFKISWPHLSLVSVAAVVPRGLWPASCRWVWPDFASGPHLCCSFPMLSAHICRTQKCQELTFWGTNPKWSCGSLYNTSEDLLRTK